MGTTGRMTISEACAVLGFEKVTATVSVPAAGAVLGFGRDTSYAAAKAGTLPTVALGRKLRVPTVRLAMMVLGEPPADDPQAGDQSQHRDNAA